MLDKTSKKVVDHLKLQPNKTCTYTFDSIHSLYNAVGNEESARAAIDFLIKQNMIEPLLDSKGKKYGIRLSHIAQHKKEFTIINLISYLKSKWIDILALIVSLFALAKSYEIL